MITRRGLLGILAAGFAPAAIGSGVLMPARKIARVAQFDPNDPLGQRRYIVGDWWTEKIELNEAWMTGLAERPEYKAAQQELNRQRRAMMGNAYYGPGVLAILNGTTPVD